MPASLLVFYSAKLTWQTTILSLTQNTLYCECTRIFALDALVSVFHVAVRSSVTLKDLNLVRAYMHYLSCQCYGLIWHLLHEHALCSRMVFIQDSGAWPCTYIHLSLLSQFRIFFPVLILFFFLLLSLFNGPLGRSLRSFARTGHFTHWDQHSLFARFVHGLAHSLYSLPCGTVKIHGYVFML